MDKLLKNSGSGGESIKRRDTWIFFSDEMIVDGAKKLQCQENHSALSKFGIVRISPFITRHLVAALIRPELPNEVVKLLNKGLQSGFEIGIFDEAISNIKDGFYGMQTPSDTTFRVCLKTNDPKILNGKYSRITFNNVRRFSQFMLFTYVFSALLLLVDWMKMMTFSKQNANIQQQQPIHSGDSLSE